MPGARCGCAAGAVRWAQSSARMSVMSERLLVSLSLALIGLLLLGVGAGGGGRGGPRGGRRGPPAVLRGWMNPLSENWMAERVVLLGLPTVGALLVCVALAAAPHQWTVLRLLAIAGMVVLAVPALYFLIAPLPLPGFLYPGWARRLRDGREARMRAFLTGQI